MTQPDDDQPDGVERAVEQYVAAALDGAAPGVGRFATPELDAVARAEFERRIRAFELVRRAMGHAPRIALDDPSSGPASTSRPTHPAPLAPSTHLGHFELLEMIGEGGMGTVYRARDLVLHREVAVKVVQGGRLASPRNAQIFMREVRAVAKLRHPNILSIHAVGDEEGIQYFVMPLVSGGSLMARLSDARDRGLAALPFPEAARILVYLADAVAAAHAASIVHRDLKPSNVLFDADGHPLLIDFGLARDVDRDPTLSAGLLGTPVYAAPERLDGSGSNDPRVDVFGLGAILYEMLTLRPPRRGETLSDILRAARELDPPPPRSINRAVPRDLNTICQKALERDPAGRYASAEALVRDLRNFIEHRPIEALPVSSLTRVRRWARRHVVAAALIALVGLAAIAFLAWWVLKPAPARILVTTPLPEIRLELVSKRDGARLQIDPSKPASVAPGAYELLATLENHRVRNIDFEALAGCDQSLNVDLEPMLIRSLLFSADTKDLHVFAADLDRDAITDLVVYRSTSRGKVLEGYRNADSVPSWERSLEWSPEMFDAADFDSDGICDLPMVIHGEHRAARAAMVVSGRDGSVIRNTRFSGDEDFAAFGDLDGDRVPDLVVVGKATISARSGRLDTPLFEPATVNSLEGFPEEILFGAPRPDGEVLMLVTWSDGLVETRSGRDGKERWHWKHDARPMSAAWVRSPDGERAIVAFNDGSVVCLDSNGRPTVWPRQDQPIDHVSALDEDLDADQVTDVVVISNCGTVATVSSATGRPIRVLTRGASPRDTSTLVGTFGGRGRDIVLGACNSGESLPRMGTVLCLPLDGTAERRFSFAGVPGPVVRGDFDGDGFDDVAVSSGEGLSPTSPQRVDIVSFRDRGFLWRFPTAGPVWSSPTVADLDRDGMPEVVIGSGDGAVYALSGRDGSLRWSFRTGGPVDGSPAIEDLNGDGVKDVVVGSRDQRIYALSGRDGAPIWPPFVASGKVASPVLDDLDGDGTLDVIASSPSQIHVLSGRDGRPLFPPISTGSGTSFKGPPHVRCDRDGRPSIVQPAEDGCVHVFSAKDGSPVRRIATGEAFQSAAAWTDFDLDGIEDFVIGVGKGCVAAFSGKDDSLLWKVASGGNQVNATPVIADFDRDGRPDVVAAPWEAGAPSQGIRAINSHGKVLWTFAGGSQVWSLAAPRDLDGDGIRDVVVGFESMPYRMCVISGRDGSLLRSLPHERMIDSVAAIADLDSDGALDAVFGGMDQMVHCISLRMELLTARRSHLTAAARAYQALEDGALVAAVNELEAESNPSPALRLAGATAMVDLGREPEAATQLAAAAAAGLRAPELGALMLLHSAKTGRPLDADVVAACALSHPEAFLMAMLEFRNLRAASNPASERDRISEVLSRLSGSDARHALARLILSLLLPDPAGPPGDILFPDDPVPAEYARIAIEVSRALSSNTRFTGSEFAPTAQHRRFAAAFPADPIELRTKLRLEPR